jgi:arylsulfatase A-like enzyme
MSRFFASRVLRIALCTAGALLTVHAASVVFLLLPSLHTLDGRARAGLVAITGHMAFFQAGVAAAVAATGFWVGLGVAVGLFLVGLTPSVLSGTLGALTVLAVWFLREIAHRPALFEDLLWRRGGFWARLEVVLAERVGVRAFDVLGASVAVGLGLMILVRHHRVAVRRVGVLGAAAAGVVLLLAWRLQGHGHRAPALVVLAADSLRADHLSGLGYSRPTTPNLDRLLAHGARSTELFVPIASTTASWTTYLTGLYPHGHGVRDLFPRADETLPRTATLPQLLERAGYETAVVSDYAGESFDRVRFGFGRGDVPPATSLEIFADREALQRMPLALAYFTGGALGQRLFPVGRYLPVNADPAVLTESVFRALDTLEASGKPFALVAFYSVTHLPFAPPMPDAALYSDPGYAGKSRYAYEMQQLTDLSRLGARPPESEQAQVRALYDGAVHAFDRELGRVLARLDADGVTERTVVVLGDHGENLFDPGATTEHGKWFAGGSMANRTVFLVDGPMAGSLHSEMASGVDVMPTLLDLAHVPAPSGLEGQSLVRPGSLDAASSLSLGSHPVEGGAGVGTTGAAGLPARSGGDSKDRPLFGETTLWLAGQASAPAGTISYPPVMDLLEVEPGSHALVLKRRYLDATVTAKLRTVREGRWQLVYTPTPEGKKLALYDLENDPWLLKDVSSAEGPRTRDLYGRLRGWMEQDPIRWLDAKEHVVRRVEQ